MPGRTNRHAVAAGRDVPTYPEPSPIARRGASARRAPRRATATRTHSAPSRATLPPSARKRASRASAAVTDAGQVSPRAGHHHRVRAPPAVSRRSESRIYSTSKEVFAELANRAVTACSHYAGLRFPSDPPPLPAAPNTSADPASRASLRRRPPSPRFPPSPVPPRRPPAPRSMHLRAVPASLPARALVRAAVRNPGFVPARVHRYAARASAVPPARTPPLASPP